MPLPSFTARPNHIHRFELSYEKISQIPPDVRGALIILGNIGNEIATLYRALMFSRHPEDDLVLRSYQTMQFIVFGRLLTGKVAEAFQFIQSRVFKQPLGKTVIPRIEANDKGREIIRAVKKQIGGDGLLTRIRNEHIFHHPQDASIEEAFKRTGPDGADWSFMMAQQVHTLCFPASSSVTLAAMLAEAGEDALEANTRLAQSTFDAAQTLLEFVEVFYFAICDAYSIVQKVNPVCDLTDVPRAENVRMPPICFSP